MQERRYKTPVCDTGDLKQNLIDAPVYHKTSSTQLLVNGESGFVEA